MPEFNPFPDGLDTLVEVRPGEVKKLGDCTAEDLEALLAANRQRKAALDADLERRGGTNQ
jgi:hypothetical protein